MYADGADYGRQGKRTPLDLVLTFGGAADELQAATWLAEKLGPATWPSNSTPPGPVPLAAESSVHG